MEVLSTQEVINQIAEVLQESDGNSIEHIANEVLGKEVRYIEDDLFEYVVPNV